YMKKIIFLAVSLIALITLSACGIEKTKTFVGEKENVEMELTYTYKGDEVIKQKSVNTLKYSDFGINDDASKKILKDEIEKQSENLQNIEGVKESIKEKDESFSEIISVDFEKANIDSLKSKNIISISGDTDKGFSMKESEKKI